MKCTTYLPTNPYPPCSSSEIPRIYFLADYSSKLVTNIVQEVKLGYKKNIFYDLEPFFKKSLPHIPLPKNTLLCPIPLHRFRYNNRGFNQSGVLADVFSKVLSFPSTQLLSRHKNTYPQATLNKHNRQNNILNCFRVQKSTSQNIQKNTPIVLVDDVTTTHATLNEAAKTLRSEGFTHISALVFARRKDAY